MASAANLRNVSLGQYVPLDSPIHRLDPRTKLVIGLVFMAGVILATRYAANVLLLVSVLALVGLARLSLRQMVAPIVPALPIILVLSFFQLLFYRDPTGLARVLFSWGWIEISTASVRLVVVALMRLIALLMLTDLITSTTTVGALTYAFEWFLSPLDRLRLPGHALAMVGAIALRFLPVLGEQMESIMQAQTSRGVGAGRTSRWALVRNARRMGRLMVPLFVDAFRRSEEMVMAMQARCYRGGRDRTHLLTYRLHRLDGVILLGSLAAMALIWWVQHSGLP